MKKTLLIIFISLLAFSLIALGLFFWFGKVGLDFLGEKIVPLAKEMHEEMDGEMGDDVKAIVERIENEGLEAVLEDLAEADEKEKGEDKEDADKDESDAEETEGEAEAPSEPGLNARGDRIYLDENTNVFVDYKSGDTLQLTKNAGTTRGCGSKILYYKDPVLSDDSQFAILPLYCEGDPTEVWVKELKTLRSGMVAFGESGSFVTEGGTQMIKIGENLHPNIMNKDTHYYSPEKGVSVFLMGGYKISKNGNINYGPRVEYMEGGLSDSRLYWMYFDDTVPATDFLDEGSQHPEYYSIQPYVEVIGGHNVVIYETPGMCASPEYVVIGEKHNYRFQESCGPTEDIEHEDIETVIKGLKLIK